MIERADTDGDGAITPEDIDRNLLCDLLCELVRRCPGFFCNSLLARTSTTS